MRFVITIILLNVLVCNCCILFAFDFSREHISGKENLINRSSLAPAITSFSPTSGSVGTLVTISGTDLSNLTAFTIGGVSAIVISNTGTTLVGMVMPGSITGTVSITTVNGTVSSISNFTVNATSFPNAQQGAKLIGTGLVGRSGGAASISISADGNTAIIGRGNDDGFKGASWVYIRSNGIWSQQGSKLVGTGGTATASQGSSVSISADGNTVIVGGRSDNSNNGAAWIFTRSNGIWIQQGAKLVGTGGTATASQGSSVSISADGNTVIVGGNGDDSSKGAAWIFTRSNGVWIQQGAKLVGTGGTATALQGSSVSISADGNTALVGGWKDDSSKGAVWVFNRVNGIWSQQGSKLVGTSALGQSLQGTSVSLSADGNTAIVGGMWDDGTQGAAWVYSRSSGIWSQQGNKLIGNGANGAASQGGSVSISADGNTAIVGGQSDDGSNGAAWIYTRTNGVWIQKGSKLLGTGAIGAASQGASVSLSADGNTAIVAGPNDDLGKGAVWVFTNGISYEGNGNTGGDAPETVTPALGNTVNLSDNTGNLIKTGYVFGGWNTAPDGGGTSYGTSDLYSFTGSTILYAKWELPPPPVITSFSPSTGSAGTLVSLSGIYFYNITSLSIGGTNAIIISSTDTSLKCMVMSGAVTGNVVLTTASGTMSSSLNFTVVPTSFPSVQQGNKLIGTDASLTATQGNSVSISADGNTAIVGGSNDYGSKGAAWIYIKSNGHWSQQGSKLIGTEESAFPYPTQMQGYSVSISGDGNTAIVGGPMANFGEGAAWVYSRSNGVWSQQGNKLIGSGAVGYARQGYSVSISADGNTAIVGGYTDDSNKGAIWIYTRTSGIWSQQGSKLVGSGAIGAALQGASVSISADGNTAIVGGNNDDSNKGAAWIFTQSNGIWSQQGNKLVGTAATGGSAQGVSVSISADGNTAIVGGVGDDAGKGAAWVYTRSNGIWSQLGGKLVGTGAIGAASQGLSVSLSADGNTAIVGGYTDDSNKGAIWIYTRSSNIWSQQGTKLVGTGADGNATQGVSVSISADGKTSIIGGRTDNGFAGAAWVFTTGITYDGNGNTSGAAPESQTASNGSSVTLSANNGNLAKTGYVFAGWNTAADGTGTSYAAGDAYSFTGSVTLYAKWEALPAAPTITSFTPTSGSVGTLVTITGTDLSNPTAFTIGGVTAIVISNTGNSLVGMVMPGASTGAISVSTTGGTASGPVSFTVTATSYPGVQLGNKLVGLGGSTPFQAQGYSVALSGDGNTAIVGAIGDNNLQGAAWIYTKSNGNWEQQGTKLVGSGADGNAEQGYAVAISADGNTAIVGGYADSYTSFGNRGAVWVFTRANGVWSQQGNKLVGSGATGGAWQGSSVSISADGNTAIVGGYGDDGYKGASWIFTRSNGVWSQQGGKLVGSGAVGNSQQGYAVSISADGNTAIVGGYADDGSKGASWVFTRIGNSWIQQGEKLVSTDNSLGRSVSLSADGNTAAIGGIGGNNDNHGVFVFVRNNGVWAQEGNKLTGPNSRFGIGGFGQSVSLSADGNTLLIGAYSYDQSLGASFVFTRSNGIWTRKPGRLIGTDAEGNSDAHHGRSVSLSADGSTAIVGAWGDASGLTSNNEVVRIGAAWIFVNGVNDYVWNGSVGTSWTNAANWTPNQVPTSQNNVTVPGGLTNYPVLNDDITVYELIIENGASIDLGLKTLTVKAGLTNNGNISGTGKLKIGGTIPQQIDGNGTVENIEVNNTSSGLFIASGDNKVNVTGIFSPTFGLTTTAGNLVFKASATKEAKVGTCGYCPTEPFSGEVTVEKYIPAKRAFRFLTPGVTTTSSIQWNWQERAAVGSTAGYPYLSGNENPLPGYGTHITGVGGSANGFDVTLANSPSLFTFDVPSYAWIAESNTNASGNTLKRGEAYRIMIKGSRAANLNENPYVPDATTLRTTGTLKVCESMTFTTSSPVVPLSNVASRFSFIGNPFWSVVDWHAVAKANIESNFYYWDPTIQGTNGRGAYVTYNEVNAANNVVGSSVDRYIQPGQAFFVRNSADVSGSVIPSVTFDYTDVVGTAPSRTSIFAKNNLTAGVEAGSELTNPVTAAATENIEKIFISLFIKQKITSGPADGFLVTYNPGFTDGYGREDAMKFSNLDENISALYNGNKHSILGMMSVEGNQVKSDTIPINMSNLYDGNYVLRITLDKGVKTIRDVYVINRVSGEVYPVDPINGLDLSFLNAAGIKTKDDLALVVNFRPLLPPPPPVKKLVAYPNPVTNGQLQLIVPLQHIKSAQELKKARVEIRTVNKRLVISQRLTLDASGKTSVNIASLASGVYVVQVFVGDKSFTEKIIKQ